MGGFGVGYQMVFIVWVYQIAIRTFPVDTFPFLCLCLFDCTDFLACVPCVKLIEPVP